MAYTTINKSSLFQNQVIYSGNGSARTISGVGFQPDFTWIKSKSGTAWHQLTDSVRGNTYQIASNSNGAGGTSVQGITSWNSDGFALGTNGDFNSGSNSFVSWNWKAGTAVSGNTSGSGTYKTYTGSVNTTSGFSIIKYTGNGTAGHTIPHHLGAVPKMIIVKKIASGADWMVYHNQLGTTNPSDKYLSLNTTAAEDNGGWNSTMPTSSVFTVSADQRVNTNNISYIAYVFTDKQGYSKFGKYIGNGGNDGAFVYTGFKPAFVMVKLISATQDWWIGDSERPGYNTSALVLKPNATDNENQSWSSHDLVSNGFKIRNSDGAANSSGGSYIYMAVGQTLVGTNNITNNAV